MKIKKINVIKEKRQDNLPDVDLDFQSAGRDVVKEYTSNKYKFTHVCSLGTYGRLKLRQSFKDLAKMKGVVFQEANELTKEMDDQLEYTWFDLFKFAAKSEKLYNFIQKYPDLISNLKVILNNPKSVSVHPSAIAILPKYDMYGRVRNLENWMPIRMIDGMIVSEWEGKYADRFGVLKEDILGLTQLDKYHYCLDLIKENTGKEIDLNVIPLDDEETYKLFQMGCNEDVFQFGSKGLKNYSKEVQPDHIEDLIAMNALYRPGTMEIGAHKDYALIKHGKKEAVFDFDMKPVTENTYGLYVYQEQIMKAVIVAGLTPVESDMFRTAIKKKDVKMMNQFFEKFISGMVQKGCEEQEAKNIWSKLLAFSGYGFNKAHAAAYALMAYQCQWLKANYPLEFWTTAFNFGKEDVDIPYYLKEISETKSGIHIDTPDINQSNIHFTCNSDENSIFWSLTKIKGIGDAAANKILEERKANGKFFSLEEFISRVPKNKVNKKSIKTLILSGCFDKLENVEFIKQRKNVLLKFYEIIKENPKECEYCSNNASDKNYYWTLLQKSLIGNGDLDFSEIIQNSNIDKKLKSSYMSFREFNKKKVQSKKFYNYGEMVSICGFMAAFRVYKYKGGEFFKMDLENNNTIIECIGWNDVYEALKDNLPTWLNKMILISGKLGFDDYRKKNTLYLSEDTEIVEL